MRRSLHRQKGIVLLIALTVLVAMSLAGVALMRSVDTTVIVSGNLAMKTSAMQVADKGTQEAVLWLNANRNGVTLFDNVDAMGYYASRTTPEPDWFDDLTWSGALAVNGGMTDSAGNVVRFVIHRMCPISGAPGTSCPRFYPFNQKVGGQSYQVGSPQFEYAPQFYYRVTTRVEGPRNNVTVVQTTVLL